MSERRSVEQRWKARDIRQWRLVCPHHIPILGFRTNYNVRIDQTGVGVLLPTDSGAEEK